MTSMELLRALIVAPALAALTGIPEPTQTPHQPQATQPPIQLSCVLKTGANIPTATTGVVGVARYQLDDKKVLIDWGWTSSGPKPKRASLQIEPVSFWPTEVAAGGTRCLLVAGKRRSRTVIEKWQFSDIPTLAPSIDLNGVVTYPEMTVPIQSRDVVLDQAVVGQDIVQFIWQNQAPLQTGVSLSLFVRFFDSKDIYRVDLLTDETTTVQLVASATQVAGALHEPRLADAFDIRWSANHSQKGYVYVLAAAYGSGSTTQALILVDSNRDGSIDLAESPTLSDWGPTGVLGVEANFIWKGF